MTRRTTRRVLVNAAGVLALVVFAFPVYWMFNSAFKPTNDVLSFTPKFFPWPFTLEHFETAITRPNFGSFVRNSLFVTLSAVLLGLVIATLAAMAVGRFNFRGRRAYIMLVLLVQLTPFEALLIPFFITLRGLDLLNQVPALIGIYFIFTMPFTIWTLRGFVAGIPRELEEAAMVDGASRFQAFMRVVFPLLAPGMVATSVFAFVTAWNEFLYAFVLMRDNANFTLPVWISSFQSAFGTDWGGTMAASSLFTVPVLVFFLIIQRKLVSGLTAGAVKG